MTTCIKANNNCAMTTPKKYAAGCRCGEQTGQSAAFAFGSDHRDGAAQAAKKKRGAYQNASRCGIQASAHAVVVRVDQTEEQHHRRWKHGPKNQAALLPPLLQQKPLCNGKCL